MTGATFPSRIGLTDRIGDGAFVARSATIFVVSVMFMAWLRLWVYREQFVALTYGLPLLLCIWHQDRRLLWGMAGTFVMMAAYKAFFVLGPTVLPPSDGAINFAMQSANILIISGVVHRLVSLTQGLRSHAARIEQQNAELTAREEEISRQNEELHAQAEELAQQNEEIQQQAEEMQHQSEELQGQSEALQAAYNEAERRESVLQSLIASLRDVEGDGDLPADICRPMISLFAGKATGAAVAERRGDRFEILSHVNMAEYANRSVPLKNTFAGLVMEEGRTAYIADLRKRDDINVVPAGTRTFRSVLATPLRVGDEIVGVVEVVSNEPQHWTKDEFKIIEWVSAQCTLVMQTRRLREQLQRANDRLDGEVRDRTGQLQEFVNELEHFSYTITHDLRAPLRAMQGFAALLGERHGDRLDAEGTQFLERISTAAARMDRLITDALSYSRIVRQELPLAPVDLSALIRGMLNSYPAFQPPAARIDVSDDLPTVLANEAGLTQLFSNLIGNAVKFVPPGRMPHVRICSELADEGTVRIAVTDNGIGIPADMHEKVFVMFQRLSKDYEGTGIGLALVRKIAERMGGSVTVESAPGEGSRFWVQLRLARGTSAR